MKEELNNGSKGIEKQEQLFVVILQLSNGRFYVEAVNNVSSRMKEHSNKKCLQTRGYLPVKLVFVLLTESTLQAEELVARIRKVGTAFWLNGLLNYELTYGYDLH